MSILRIYDPPECDSNGDPLDWERCRACAGSGKVQWQTGCGDDDCEVCGGFGSLKAAALAHFSLSLPYNAAKHFAKGPEGASGWLCGTPEWRCESCSHPMSEGTWGGLGEFTPLAVLTRVERDLRIAGDTAFTDGLEVVHYSPCDEGCDHGGQVRANDSSDLTKTWEPLTLDADALRAVVASCAAVEASWRQVDIRRMGWPHDLRLERLSVLCTRCYAERTTKP